MPAAISKSIHYSAAIGISCLGEDTSITSVSVQSTAEGTLRYLIPRSICNAMPATARIITNHPPDPINQLFPPFTKFFFLLMSRGPTTLLFLVSHLLEDRDWLHSPFNARIETQVAILLLCGWKTMQDASEPDLGKQHYARSGP